MYRHALKTLGKSNMRDSLFSMSLQISAAEFWL